MTGHSSRSLRSSRTTIATRAGITIGRLEKGRRAAKVMMLARGKAKAKAQSKARVERVAKVLLPQDPLS